MASSGATKTGIATKMGLNFQRAAASVELLLATGYLHSGLWGGQIGYLLTGKGEQFLSGLELIRNDLDDLFLRHRRSAVLIEGRVGSIDRSKSQV